MKPESVRSVGVAALALALALPAAAQKPEKPAPKVEKAAAKPDAKPSPSPSPAAKASPSPSPSPAASPTPAPPVTVVVQAPPPAAEPKSDLVSGWIGLAILGAGGFFGWRALKSRGMSVTQAFRRIGVDLPTEPVGGPAVAPARPQPAPLPPLPSLSDLPAAGPAAPSPAAAPPVAAGPRLVGTLGPVAGEAFALTGILTVGRDVDNAIALPQDSTLSRRHARIEPRGADWTVEDLGSSNGTFVNGQRLVGAQTLRPGDEIKTGGAAFRFEA